MSKSKKDKKSKKKKEHKENNKTFVNEVEGIEAYLTSKVSFVDKVDMNGNFILKKKNSGWNKTLTKKKKKDEDIQSIAWGWSDKCYQRSTRFGFPPNVKMYISPCPKPLQIENMLPPKILTDGNEVDDYEEEERVIKEEDKDVEEIAITPIDGDDPLIYSNEIGVPPLSFLDEYCHQYTNKAPPPTYIPYKKLSEPKPTRKDKILNGLAINKDGVLQCVDKVMLEKSKGVISYVIKQIAKNIFSGLGVVAISLPVRIFEPRSALERVLDGFSFAPKYLNEACRRKDPIDRMKSVIAFAVSGIYMRANQRKPFNPLLGETLEGKYSDGTKIFMEHISHHPPISSYLIEGPGNSNYKFYGSNEFVGSIKSGGNILSILFKGSNTVEFPDGDTIVFQNQPCKVKGLMWGDKLINMEGFLEFVDEENKIKAIIIMDPKVRELNESDDPNYFEGMIYYYSDSKKSKEPEKVSAIGDVSEEICYVHGSWLQELLIDDRKVWDIDNEAPSRIIFPKRCLPSDARYREDLIWLFNENEDYAQEWKSLLEVQQRKDRSNRQTVEKKRGKNKPKFFEVK